LENKFLHCTFALPKKWAVLGIANTEIDNLPKQFGKKENK